MKRYLFPADYMADPAVHVFNGKIFVYPVNRVVKIRTGEEGVAARQDVE